MDPLRLRTCTVDLRAMRVLRDDGSAAPLSARDAQVLAFLAARPGQTVDRDTLYTEIWGYADAVLSRAVDALVRRVRAKIEADPSNPDHLLTVHGEGYRFEPGNFTLSPPIEAGTLVAVGRDPLARADPVALAQWVAQTAREAELAGGTAHRDGSWSFAVPAIGAGFCLASVDAGRAVGARGAAVQTGDAAHLLRMLAAAAPGRVILGDDLYVEVAMASGIRDRVWRRLSGVRLTLDGPPERLVETGGTDEGGLRGVAGNLRPPPNRTIGRSTELSQALERFGHGRLVTLTGTGGVGKTRLSLEIGVEWRARGGGAWFCDLSACTSLEDVVGTVFRTVEVSPGQELLQALGHLGGDLLVLDNAEQCVEAVRVCVERWVRLERGPFLLVTSRERLGIAAEDVLDVAPLRPDDAVALFAERAPGADDGAVSALVARIDRLPLAIELAAARSELLPPAEILARLERGLSAVGREPGRVPRQADLRAMVRWSWDLLDPAEQEVLVACGTFTGPFESDGVAAVLGHRDPDAVVDLLHALRRKGLLVRAGDRMQLYAAVRAFALEQTDPETAAGHRDRHAEWFARWGTEESEDAVYSAAGEVLLARQREDLPDLLTALEHALAHGLPCTREAFIGVAEALQTFGPRDRIEHYAASVLAAGHNDVRVQVYRYDPHAPVAVLQEVYDALCAWPDDGRALWVRARIADVLARPEDLIHRAVERLRATGDRTLVAALRTQVHCLLGEDRSTEAVAPARESLALARRQGDRASECNAQLTLAVVSLRLGALDEALNGIRKAVELAEGLIDPYLRANASLVMTSIHLVRDEPGPAVRAALGCLHESRRAGSWRLIVSILCYLAEAAMKYQSASEARRWLKEAFQTLDEAGWSHPRRVFGLLGAVELADGRAPEAIVALEQAIARTEDTRPAHLLCTLHANLGVARRLSGDLPRALEDLDAAVRVGSPLESKFAGTWRASAERAVVRAAVGDRSGALEDLAVADRLVGLGWSHHRLVRMKVDLCRAEVMLAAGDREGTVALVSRVRSEVDRAGLGPTTVLGARLQRFEHALRSGT